MMTEDQQLLGQYVQQHSLPALDELIRRHLNLVYSSALRQTYGDSHLAQDVTQAVFIVLTRKAHTIRKGASIGSWLISVTRRAALNMIRKQATQRRHETAAARPEAAMDNQSTDWSAISPLLDEALDRLGRKDRDAVVLRYLQGRSFAQVGLELGLKEPAARKRVGRAVDKLRRLLCRSGVGVEPEALGAMIAANGLRVAPAHLSVATGVSAAAGSTASAVITAIVWGKAKAAAVLVAGAVVLLGGAAIIATTMAQPQASIPPATHPATLPATVPVPFDEMAARRAIVQRFRAMQNLSVAFHSETRSTGLGIAIPGQPGARDGGEGVSDSSDLTISWLDGKLRMDRVREMLDDPNRSRVTNTSVIRGDRIESLTEGVRNGKSTYSGGAGKAGILREPILFALGLAHQRNLESPESPAISLDELEKVQIVPAPAGRVTMKRPLGESSEEWEFRPEMGYAMSAYRAKGAGPIIEVEPGDFRQVGGLALPYSVRMTLRSGLNAQFMSRTDVTVQQYRLDDPGNNESRYHLKWPEGTQLAMDGGRVNFIAGKDGELISLDDLALAKFKDFARAAATQPVAGGTTLSAPLTGLMLNDIQLRRQESILDLVAGTVGNFPASKDQRFDLLVRTQAGGEWRLGGTHNTLLFKLADDAFEKKDVTAIKAAIASGEPGVRVSFLSDTEIDYVIGRSPEFPMTFAYRTRDGYIGMLRILEVGSGRAKIDLMRIE
jgi:RNA polymerase sigma factor (sigma-70 family)